MRAATPFGCRVRSHQAAHLIGRDILGGSPAPLLRVAEQIAFTHHERWDGRGYHGLAAEAIPVEGRIVCVADTFDALINDRPYRVARPVAAALDAMRRERGAQFDPCVLDAFLTLVERGELEDSAPF